MPYSGPNDDKLPKNVSNLPEGERARWVEIWNSAYEKCQEEHGEDCEASAFRQANGVVLKADEMQFITNQIQAQVRHETVGGTEYLVSPVIAARGDTVMNGELVPAAELRKLYRGWNGRPVVLGHPRSADGMHISANAPETFATCGLGWLYGAEYDEEKKLLRGELWLDVAQAKLVDRGPEVIEALERGHPLEVSTAYFRDREEHPGSTGDVVHEAIAHNLRPDHVAILLDEPGACSWDCGCGTPRVNDGGDVVDDELKTNIAGKTEENGNGIVRAFKALAAALGLSKTMEDEMTEIEQVTTQEDTTMGDTGKEAAPAKAELPASLVAFVKALESQEGGVEKLAVLLSNADALVALLDTAKARADVQKEAVVNALASNAACAFSREALEGMDLQMLELLHHSLTPAVYSGQGVPVPGNGKAKITPLPVLDIHKIG